MLVKHGDLGFQGGLALSKDQPVNTCRLRLSVLAPLVLASELVLLHLCRPVLVERLSPEGRVELRHTGAGAGEPGVELLIVLVALQ